MGNPAEKNADTQGEQGQKAEKPEPTFADRVNEAVNTMAKDDEGNWVLPEGEELSEEVRVAAISEKRYRDTQSAYTRTNQQKKALEAENSVLLKKAVGNVELSLTAEQAEELEDLKFSDPEAWRKKLNVYENEALAKHEEELNEEVKKVSNSSLDEQELERRKQVTANFLADHEGFVFTDEVWQNDIPPRINKKLENGDISFEEFLSECHSYLTTGKVVKQDDDILGQPNLGKVGGGSRPDKNAVKEDAIQSYNTETF